MSLGELSLYAFLQGMSEFLPISSSGHLALYHHYLGLSEEEQIRYVLAAHLGTLLGVVVYLRKELLSLVLPFVGGRNDAGDSGDSAHSDGLSGHSTEDLSEELSEDLSGHSTEDLSKELSEDLSGHSTEDLSKELSEDLSGHSTEDLSEELSEDLSEHSIKDLSKDFATHKQSEGLFSGGLFALARGRKANALRWLVVMIVANIPAILVGLTMKGVVEHSFQDLRLIGGGFLFTAAVLLIMRSRERKRTAQMIAHNPNSTYDINDSNSAYDINNPNSDPNNIRNVNEAYNGSNIDNKNIASKDSLSIPQNIPQYRSQLYKRMYMIALGVGIAQAIAFLPGISRSGLTIAVGYLLGLPSVLAAQFSFLIVIPLIGGGFLLELIQNPPSSWDSFLPMLGVIALSGLFGIGALKVIFTMLHRNVFYYFAYYLILLGFLTIFYIPGKL